MTISGCPAVSSPHLVQILHRLPKCEFAHQKATRPSCQERATFPRPHQSYKNYVNCELETKNNTFQVVLGRLLQQAHPPDITKTMVDRVSLHSQEPASNAIQPQPSRRYDSNCKSSTRQLNFLMARILLLLGSAHLFTCITGRLKLQSLSAQLSKIARLIVALLIMSYIQMPSARLRCRWCSLYSLQRSRKSKISSNRSRSTSSLGVELLKETSWIDPEILHSTSKCWFVSRTALAMSQMTMTSPLWPRPAQIIVDQVYKR